jgi:crotonobetaine/carnitine-CoA ligase
VIELDPPSGRTIPALLVRNADRYPSRPFLSDESGTLSHAEVLAFARRIGAGFARLGVTAGDHVAIMLDNRREFIGAWFGLSLLGAVEVPVNQQNVGNRLVHVLNHSRSTVLVVQSDYLAQVEAVQDRLTHLEIVVVVGTRRQSRFRTVPWSDLDDGSEVKLGSVRLSQSAVVMYTSGSTGPAKGAILSHGHHYMNGFQAASAVGITEDDRIFVCTPLHHNMAQGYGVLPALVAGAGVHIAARFDRRTFWDEVAVAQATVLAFVGAMLVLLAKNSEQANDNKHTLRVGYGVPIPAEIHRPFERRFGMELIHCYGSTEATIVAWNTGAAAEPGAAGLPFPGYEVKVVDDEDFSLPTGEVGQICVRSSEPWSMFSGYLDDAERTAACWRNGWFHTGDRGRFDAHGRLWFTDRLGDVIRCKGESVSAYEIEEVVIAYNAISLVAAYGTPNQLGDEDIVLAVVPARDDFDSQGFAKWCGEHLPRYALPRYVDVLPALPMTPTGKIEKYKLRREGPSQSAFDARVAIAPSDAK